MNRACSVTAASAVTGRGIVAMELVKSESHRGRPNQAEVCFPVRMPGASAASNVGRFELWKYNGGNCLHVIAAQRIRVIMSHLLRHGLHCGDHDDARHEVSSALVNLKALRSAEQVERREPEVVDDRGGW